MEPVSEIDTPPPSDVGNSGGKKRGGGPPPRVETSATAEALAVEDDKSVFDWLANLGGSSAVRVDLIRNEPKDWEDPDTGQRVFLRGVAEQYEGELPTLADVRNIHGGGKYQVKAWRRNPKGGWMYAGAKTFEIGGNPKIPNSFTGKVAKPAATTVVAPREDISLQKAALDMMRDSAARAEQRANEVEDRKRNQPLIDPSVVELVTAPLKAQVAAMEADNRRRDAAEERRQAETATRKPEEATFSEKLADKLIDGESARVTALRAQWDSERSQLVANHVAEMRASRERFDQELRTKEEGHKRELSMLEKSNASQLDSMKQAHEGRIETLKSRITDLERQIARAELEATELKARKDKGPFEAMEDVVKMKSSLEALGLVKGEDDEGGGSIWEKIIFGFMDSPLARAAANRIEQAPPAQPPPRRPPQAAQSPQRRPPPRRPKPAQPAASVANAADAAAEAAGGPLPEVPAPVPVKKKALPKLNPNDVTVAVGLIEAAIRNGTDPNIFAQSARSMIPVEIVTYVQEAGIDNFLKNAVKLEDGSPLKTQNGRNWIRNVAKILMT